MSTTKTVIEFDHHSQEFKATRDETLRGLRETTPIAWTNAHGGYWFITSYALITEVLRNSAVFRSERLPDGGGGITIPENKFKPSVLPGELDGIAHDRFRQALNPFFAKPKVTELTEAIEKIMDDLLDALVDRDRFDAVSELAQALTVRAALRYVGIDTDDAWSFFEDCTHVREQPTSDEAAAVIARIKAFVDAKRGEEPKDVLGFLLAGPEPFTDDEFVGIVIGLVLGAVRTTADTLVHGLDVFDQDRELRARLIAEPEATTAAVEEVLRTHSPTLGLARTAMADAVVGGQQIRQGDRLLMAYHSGNLDDANFPNAATIDLERKRSPHLTFGRGSHFCLGNWLARLELRIAFQKILERMPDYTVDRAAGEYTETVGLRNAWEKLPLVPRP
ncbi:MAG: hypothetical protein ABS81_00600 [Pseudonocardia sp. SCN 72-86]|nr:MAG: hypothetical protein ABS81_00600 [Pseudonocardia sp. SCN 72-86]